MPTVQFGSRTAAKKIRNDPKFKPFLKDVDDGRQATVRLKKSTPQSALNEITGEAADSKRHEAEKAGQIELSRRERKHIDFKREGVNVPKARSIKGIATHAGVDDWESFADFELTVDENRELLKRASKEDSGRRGLGSDRMDDAQVDKRIASGHHEREQNELGRAKEFGIVDQDDEAQSFVQDQGDTGDVFDIGFGRGKSGQIFGQGDDFDRVERRHESRSSRAQTVDEKRTAPVTLDPFVWANNPNEYDFPGVDTVQPNKLHQQRTEQAQEVDNNELAPITLDKEKWAMNPDKFDYPGVDTPSDYDS